MSAPRPFVNALQWYENVAPSRRLNLVGFWDFPFPRQDITSLAPPMFGFEDASSDVLLIPMPTIQGDNQYVQHTKQMIDTMLRTNCAPRDSVCFGESNPYVADQRWDYLVGERSAARDSLINRVSLTTGMVNDFNAKGKPGYFSEWYQTARRTMAYAGSAFAFIGIVAFSNNIFSARQAARLQKHFEGKEAFTMNVRVCLNIAFYSFSSLVLLSVVTAVYNPPVPTIRVFREVYPWLVALITFALFCRVYGHDVLYMINTKPFHIKLRCAIWFAPMNWIVSILYAGFLVMFVSYCTPVNYSLSGVHDGCMYCQNAAETWQKGNLNGNSQQMCELDKDFEYARGKTETNFIRESELGKAYPNCYCGRF